MLTKFQSENWKEEKLGKEARVGDFMAGGRGGRAGLSWRGNATCGELL
jgi:hypothetical protein